MPITRTISTQAELHSCVSFAALTMLFSKTCRLKSLMIVLDSAPVSYRSCRRCNRPTNRSTPQQYNRPTPQLALAEACDQGHSVGRSSPCQRHLLTCYLATCYRVTCHLLTRCCVACYLLTGYLATCWKEAHLANLLLFHEINADRHCPAEPDVRTYTRGLRP